MSLRDIIEAHQRLCILRLLMAASRYTLNDSLLRGGLETFGLDASRDQAKSLLAWLEEQRLIKQKAAAETAIIVTLTDRGHDVASGTLQHPGVQRPSPTSVGLAALRAAAGLPTDEG